MFWQTEFDQLCGLAYGVSNATVTAFTGFGQLGYCSGKLCSTYCGAYREASRLSSQWLNLDVLAVFSDNTRQPAPHHGLGYASAQ